MDKQRFFADFNILQKTELYPEIIKWVGEQMMLFQNRCIMDADENEWKRNQGRARAYATVLDRLKHPEKILADREKKVETTTTG